MQLKLVSVSQDAEMMKFGIDGSWTYHFVSFPDTDNAEADIKFIFNEPTDKWKVGCTYKLDLDNITFGE